MNKELKDKWVAALRSGEYKQNRDGRLYNAKADSFCCLGVLNEIEGRSRMDVSVYCRVSPYSMDLWTMNDGAGCKAHTFPEIADWIEENVDASE